MRSLLLLSPLLILAACTTPRESCVSDASREIRTINNLISKTRGNLSRGYAIERRQEVRTVRSQCQGTNDDGSTFTFRCDKTRTVTRRSPVAIDLNGERAKLESLEQRKQQMLSNRNAAIQQCNALYPE